ncbi:MAG: hypothetical protein E7666_08190 [Ruminococcaceae bacterium]|nr:hypothetical protein [Oscillospiraceae bacterium]
MDTEILRKEEQWNEDFYQKEEFEYADAQAGYDPLKDANLYGVLKIDYRKGSVREEFPNVNLHSVFCRITDRFLKSAPNCFPDLTSCEEYLSNPTLNRFYHLVEMALAFARSTHVRLEVNIVPKTTEVSFLFTSEKFFLMWNSFSFLESVFQQAKNLMIVAGETGIRCNISFPLFEAKAHYPNIEK